MTVELSLTSGCNLVSPSSTTVGSKPQRRYRSPCDLVTNRRHRYLQITLQTLHISLNIFHARHDFKIVVVIGPIATSYHVIR